MSELFEQLLEYKWRDIPFPATDFHVSLRHDLVQHKFAEKDGADIEATGRAPMQFTARIPFLNHIVPAKSETWASPLYPDHFRRWFASMANKAKGVMQHPEFGFISCRVEHANVTWAAGVQGGVFVDASWLETFDEFDSLEIALAATSPIANAIGAAQDLDASITDLKLPDTPTFAPDFADTMRGLQGVFDQTTLLSRQVAGQIDSVAYRVNALADSITRASHSQAEAAESVQNWQVRDAIDRVKSAMNDLRSSLLTTGKAIALYVPQADTSVPLIAQTLNVAINDVMTLNPTLLAIAYVPALSRVRYYPPSGTPPFQQLQT